MKYLPLLIVLFTTSISAQSLDAVRASYVHVNEGDDAITLFEKSLESTQPSSNVINAYKGALMTLQSKLVKGIKNKKMLFREGVAHLEKSVLNEPNNIEIRTIRLSVQENTPKFLKYHSACEEDKEFILSNFSKITATTIRTFVKGYVQQSTIFTEEEKSKL